MTRIHNTNDDRLPEIFRRSDTLETMAPMGHSAVPKGASRFIGNESLLVEGSQKVSGWLIVTGTLKVVGTFLLEGITTITGALTARGTTRFEGDTTQVGPLGLEGDFTVKAGGKITVAGTNPIVLGQAGGAAQIQMGSAKLIGAPDGFALGIGDRLVSAGSAGVMLQGGAKSVSVEAATGTTVTGGSILAGGIKIPSGVANLPTISGVTSNLYWDAATTQLKRIV